MKKLLSAVLALTTLSAFAYDFDLINYQEITSHSTMSEILRYPHQEFSNPLCIYDSTLGGEGVSSPGLGNGFLINMALGYKLTKIGSVRNDRDTLKIELTQEMHEGNNHYSATVNVYCPLTSESKLITNQNRYSEIKKNAHIFVADEESTNQD